MKKIGLLSDTHSYLDEQIFELFADCDEVWHAGDFGEGQVLERLQTFKPLRGVYGNIDTASVRAQMPENEIFDLEGLRVVMTHIGGSAQRYSARVRALLSQYQPHIFICGHSHILQIQPQAGFNCLHINPGAAGNEGWHKERTALRFSVEAAKIQNLELLRLGTRGLIQG